MEQKKIMRHGNVQKRRSLGFVFKMIEFIQPACYVLIVSKKKKLKKNYLKCTQDNL